MASINDIFSNYPPDIPDEQLEYLVSVVKNWTIQHGLTVRPSTAIVPEDTNPNHVLATNAPVTLFPSPFPKACFEQARSLQTVYNELYAAVASNERWLETIMKEYVPKEKEAPGEVADPQQPDRSRRLPCSDVEDPLSS
jgi:glutathione synthase